MLNRCCKIRFGQVKYGNGIGGRYQENELFKHYAEITLNCLTVILKDY